MAVVAVEHGAHTMMGAADATAEHGMAQEPASIGAEVGRQVTLRIANQTLLFRAEIPGLQLYLHDSHFPFRVPDATPADCSVDWSIEELKPASAPVTRRFEERWEIRRLDYGWEEITFYNAIGSDPQPQPSMQMISDPEFTTVRIRQAPRGAGRLLAYVSEYPWAEYIVQRRMGLHGGVMLHASMAVWNGVAHLFMGHSGAGKSTIAELAEQIGATIPTDDRTILMPGENGVTAWGTPWHGSFRRSSPHGAAVGSISLLVQDTHDELDRMEASRAVKEMFVRTVQARVTEREVQTTLDSLEAIAAKIPCFELRFLPTPSAVELVLRATASGKTPGALTTSRQSSWPAGEK